MNILRNLGIGSAMLAVVSIASFSLAHFLIPLVFDNSIDYGGSYFSEENTELERQLITNSKNTSAIIVSIFTVLGIFASILWEAFHSGEKLRLKTLAPLLVSPIVIFVTYAAAKDHPDSFVAMLIAFENGFFWQAILGARRREPQTPQAAP